MTDSAATDQSIYQHSTSNNFISIKSIQSL